MKSFWRLSLKIYSVRSSCCRFLAAIGVVAIPVSGNTTPRCARSIGRRACLAQRARQFDDLRRCHGFAVSTCPVTSGGGEVLAADHPEPARIARLMKEWTGPDPAQRTRRPWIARTRGSTSSSVSVPSWSASRARSIWSSRASGATTTPTRNNRTALNKEISSPRHVERQFHAQPRGRGRGVLQEPAVPADRSGDRRHPRQHRAPRWELSCSPLPQADQAPHLGDEHAGGRQHGHHRGGYQSR